MQSLAHYALLGSVLSGIAGAAILALVTIQHGLKSRRALADGDDPAEHSQRARTARVADALAVLCFAVAASLGVFGLTQQSRAPGGAADSVLAERVQRLETRLAGTESELHARSAPTDLKAWEERLARLESRLGAVEERAAVADRRLGATEERVAAADRRVHADERLAREHRAERVRDTPMLSPNLAPTSPTPAAVKPAATAPTTAPPRSTPVAPERPEASLRPGATPAPASSAPPPANAAVAPAAKPEAPKLDAPPGHAATAQAMPAPRREPARAQRAPAQKPTEPSLGQKLRQDWEAIKRDASRSGDDWRQGWDQLRRLFTP